MRRLLVVSLLLAAGCKRTPHPPAPTNLTSAGESGDESSDASSSDLAQSLEKAFEAAEKSHPNGFPRCGPTVKGPCEPETKMRIARLHGEQVDSSADVLPPALHGHGERLRAAYVAPDGVEFFAGYNYTGVPGPDTGVVYRHDVGGRWTIVYSKKENELGHLFGTSSKDVWVSGAKTLAHWDGVRWNEETVPDLEGSLAGVFARGKELFVVGGTFKLGRIWHRDPAGAWRVEAHTNAMLHGVGGTASTVIAVGDDGQILRRQKDGSWTNEGTTKAQNTEVFAPDDQHLYVAGSRLLRSRGDGAWTTVALPTSSQATHVWGRSATDLYADTLGGLYHLRGSAWVPTEWTQGVDALGGNSREVLVAWQEIVR